MKTHTPSGALYGVRVVLAAALLCSLLSLVPGPASAQAGLSVWAGIGASAQDGDASFSRDTKQVGAQLSAPAVPIALRADALLLGDGVDLDALSYNANAVFRISSAVIQPYGVLGYGRYAVTESERDPGWNGGVGVHIGAGNLGVFAELRHHWPLGRTITVAGVTF